MSAPLQALPPCPEGRDDCAVRVALRDHLTVLAADLRSDRFQVEALSYRVERLLLVLTPQAAA